MGVYNFRFGQVGQITPKILPKTGQIFEDFYLRSYVHQQIKIWYIIMFHSRDNKNFHLSHVGQTVKNCQKWPNHNYISLFFSYYEYIRQDVIHAPMEIQVKILNFRFNQVGQTAKLYVLNLVVGQLSKLAKILYKLIPPVLQELESLNL